MWWLKGNKRTLGSEKRERENEYEPRTQHAKLTEKQNKVNERT